MLLDFFCRLPEDGVEGTFAVSQPEAFSRVVVVVVGGVRSLELASPGRNLVVG